MEMFMPVPRIRILAIAALIPATLAACAYDDRGYGYGRVDAGYGYGNAYRYSPYYGWYDRYYYPGRGYYVYDRYGDRHRWNERQRRYWEDRRREWRQHNRGDYRENWSGYRRDDRRDRRSDEDRRRRWQERLGGD